MKIWHVNIGNHAGAVDGVAVVANRLASDQARAGHDVRLIVAADPAHHEGIRATAGDGVALTLGATARATVQAATALLSDPTSRPDVLHLHSVFRPAHRLLAFRARRRGVPYVLSPHSGLAPVLLQRDRARKLVYGAAVERRFYRQADGVHALQTTERDDVARYSRRRRAITVIPNPVDAPLLSAPGWQPENGTAPETAAQDGEQRKRVVLLCRYDVYQKGLDRLATLAPSLPDVDFEVFGSSDKNQPEAAEALIRSAPANLRFRPPVHGEDKLRTLRDADLFLQPSRVEGLSVALAEALTLGLPCAVSTYVGESLGMGEKGSALVLADEPTIAAGQIGDLLADREALVSLASAGRKYAHKELDPATVTDHHLSHYEAVIRGRSVPDAATT